MNNKQLALIILAIIVGCCIIAGAVIYSNGSDEPANVTITNNTTNMTENATNITEDVNEDVQSDSGGKSNSEESVYVTDAEGTTYNKNTGEVVWGQAQGMNYYEVQKQSRDPDEIGLN